MPKAAAKGGGKKKSVRSSIAVCLSSRVAVKPDTQKPHVTLSKPPLPISELEMEKGTPSTRTRGKMTLYRRALEHFKTISGSRQCSESESRGVPHLHCETADPTAEPKHIAEDAQRESSPLVTSSSDAPVATCGSAHERRILCVQCQALVLACRTHLAQFGDARGVLASKYGVLCDERLLASASRIANRSITIPTVKTVCAAFPGIVSATWMLLRGTNESSTVGPRLQVISERIPSLTDLEVLLAGRFQTDRDMLNALTSPCPLADAADHTVSVTASPLKPAAPVESAACSEPSLPSELAAFLSPRKAQEVRAFAALDAHATATHAVARVSERCAMDTVMPSYDRIRSHLGPRRSTVGTLRARELLTQLSIDQRPVDDATALDRLKLLLSFGSCAGFTLRGSLDDGVLSLDQGLSRATLARRVIDRASSTVTPPM